MARSSTNTPLDRDEPLGSRSRASADIQRTITGVRRISTGSLLARSAYGALMSGARELFGDGTSDYARSGVAPDELKAAFG